MIISIWKLSALCSHSSDKCCAVTNLRKKCVGLKYTSTVSYTNFEANYAKGDVILWKECYKSVDLFWILPHCGKGICWPQ
jgi:hypothetical protein